MAIKTQRVSKRDNGTWIVTVYDDQDQVGTNEDNNPIYRTYTVIHNPKDGDSVLKKKIEDEINVVKAKLDEEESFKASVDNVVKDITISS